MRHLKPRNILAWQRRFAEKLLEAVFGPGGRPEALRLSWQTGPRRSLRRSRDQLDPARGIQIRYVLNSSNSRTPSGPNSIRKGSICKVRLQRLPFFTVFGIAGCSGKSRPGPAHRCISPRVAGAEFFRRPCLGVSFATTWLKLDDDRVAAVGVVVATAKSRAARGRWCLLHFSGVRCRHCRRHPIRFYQPRVPLGEAGSAAAHEIPRRRRCRAPDCEHFARKRAKDGNALPRRDGVLLHEVLSVRRGRCRRPALRHRRCSQRTGRSRR